MTTTMIDCKHGVPGGIGCGTCAEETAADTGQLTRADRTKARDVARHLIDKLHAAMAADGLSVAPEWVRDLAAAIRDLDAVARGPL